MCLIHDRNSWKVSLNMVVIDVGEEKNEEPVTSQVIRQNPSSVVCLVVECCAPLTDIENLWLLW